MTTDGGIPCRFGSVVVGLCFLEEKPGSDHPPAVPPLVPRFFFFEMSVDLEEGVPDKDLSSALTI